MYLVAQWLTMQMSALYIKCCNKLRYHTIENTFCDSELPISEDLLNIIVFLELKTPLLNLKKKDDMQYVFSDLSLL